MAKVETFHTSAQCYYFVQHLHENHHPALGLPYEAEVTFKAVKQLQIKGGAGKTKLMREKVKPIAERYISSDMTDVYEVQAARRASRLSALTSSSEHGVSHDHPPTHTHTQLNTHSPTLGDDTSESSGQDDMSDNSGEDEVEPSPVSTRESDGVCVLTRETSHLACPHTSHTHK